MGTLPLLGCYTVPTPLGYKGPLLLCFAAQTPGIAYQLFLPTLELLLNQLPSPRPISTIHPLELKAPGDFHPSVPRYTHILCSQRNPASITKDPLSPPSFLSWRVASPPLQSTTPARNLQSFYMSLPVFILDASPHLHSRCLPLTFLLHQPYLSPMKVKTEAVSIPTPKQLRNSSSPFMVT